MIETMNPERIGASAITATKDIEKEVVINIYLRI
jgi:hypothetical protein